MPTNPYAPPKEVEGRAKAGIAPILWLVVGCAAATALFWPCLMAAVFATLPSATFGPGEDHGVALIAELEMRLVLSAVLSLPLAVIGGVLVMVVGNRRR